MASITTNPFALSLDAAAMSMPEIQANVYQSALARYNLFGQLVDRLNNYQAVQTPNPKYTWGVYPPARVSYSVASTTVLGNGNLEVTLNIPGGAGASNIYRVTETVQDNNAVKGRIVAKTPTTIELKKQSGSWNTATQFTAGMSVFVTGNAQIYGGSGQMESLKYLVTQDYNYSQIQREGHTILRRDLYKKTWFKNNGKDWYDFDLSMANVRYLKGLEDTAFWGERGIDGVEDDPNSVYYSDGLRNRIITKNPELYLSLTNQLTESVLQDYISQYKTKTRNIKEVIVMVGAQALANLQANVTQQYVLEAGNKNTFGGIDVTGLNVMKYAFNGITLGFMDWDMLNDPRFDTNISTITGKPRWQSSMLFWSGDKIEGSEGMLNPVIPKYIGENRRLTGFLQGVVDPQMVNREMFSNALNLGSSFVQPTDDVSYVVYGDESYQIEPQNMGLIELAS